MMLELAALAALTQTPLVVQTPCAGFTVVTTSPSGAPAEDDGVVELLINEARVRLPLAPAMFTATSERAAAGRNPKRLCREGLVAWEVRPHLVVLLLTRSGRPGLDLISLALVDLAKRKSLAVLETPYAVASGRAETARGVEFHLITREAQGGFDVRAVRESLPDDDGPDGALEDWLAVRVKGQRLSATWLRP
jgi:hypothetical protein